MSKKSLKVKPVISEAENVLGMTLGMALIGAGVSEAGTSSGEADRPLRLLPPLLPPPSPIAPAGWREGTVEFG